MAQNNLNNTCDAILKDVYRDCFRIGVACEKINGPFKNHEIGNPAKEELMLRHFNSMTFGNELKPAYNMGFASPEAKEDYLPFVINPAAKDMLDWAKTNGMPVRGHVMVWHSQCANEAFCKGYTPITIPTDPAILKERPMMKRFEKLDPVCFVSRETMLKRLESYITSLLEYMYANDYARTVYAWDVVNEAIELDDKTETGLRNSYWYQVIGDDFIYWSFKFAHDAVQTLSVKYAAKYGVDASDASALREIQPRLFYNDYNEMVPAKKAAIIAALQREGHGHGSIIGEGLIDGIGMQGHISDNNDIPEIITALNEYSALVSEVHITELDVKCTCSGINEEYYQAVFYQKLFEELIKAVRGGAHLTCVTFWGLTDDNSWIRGANPLIFHGDLSTKKSFDALIYAVNGGDLGEPETVIYNLSDRSYDFEPESKPEKSLADQPAPAPGGPFALPESPVGYRAEDIGFKMIGYGMLEIQDRVVHSGRYALACEKRFGNWSFIGLNISDFIGQTIDISAWVQSPALSVSLIADGQKDGEYISKVATKAGEWVLLKARYRVPFDAHSMFIHFETEEPVAGVFSPVYVDDMSVKLIGIAESFEDEKNIAAIRGVGHLPFICVTDRESVDNASHSLSVTRQEKDATVKFGISQFIGHKICITAYVKTADKLIRMGIDTKPATELVSIPSASGEWTQVSAYTELPDSLKSAEFYIETDGNAEMFIDNITVTLA